MSLGLKSKACFTLSRKKAAEELTAIAEASAEGEIASRR